MADFIYMEHPDTEGTAGPVSRSSFKNLWEKKGWVEVDAPAAEDTLEERKLDPAYEVPQVEEILYDPLDAPVPSEDGQPAQPEPDVETPDLVPDTDPENQE